MEEIRRRHPDYKILLTFFSPSGYEIRKNYAGADYIFYLPIDTRRNVRRFLDIVRPEVVIFVKYEFWLNMLLELGRREIRTFVVSAIFRPNSVFFRPWGGLWRRALKSFEAIFVQNNASKLLLGKLGHTNVQVAGDTRFDRVAEIAANAKRVELIERFKGDKPLFVAGSTWGPDEEHLLPIVNENPTLKFVIAPHEMDEGRINHLIEATRGGAVRYTECNETTDFSTTQLLILDTVGLLASVYGSATWSYIGGGFGVGIHNTLEAATFGLPIAFGPNYHKFKEACELIEVGAARSFTTTDELRAWFAPLRDDAEALKRSGEAARSYTQKNQGATKLILDTIFRA
jgi:3-deoxy-D-manno-octulosonic-acid transferase